MNLDSCHMLRVPKVTVVYIYAVGGAGGYRDKAIQFVDSYHRCPPGLRHETVIVCNGVPAGNDERILFASLPGLSFLEHDDSGWDIGGFQLAARTIQCDLMVFCGGHTYFRKPGWLARMFDVYSKHGNTLYGSTGNQGNMGANIHPHVRTTGFWCHPSLLLRYPNLVTSHGGGGQRYEMEHGTNCFTNFVRNAGLTPWIVGWDCERAVTECDQIPNGYHQGDQSNVLVGDRMTSPPYHHCP